MMHSVGHRVLLHVKFAVSSPYKCCTPAYMLLLLLLVVVLSLQDVIQLPLLQQLSQQPFKIGSSSNSSSSWLASNSRQPGPSVQVRQAAAVNSKHDSSDASCSCIDNVSAVAHWCISSSSTSSSYDTGSTESSCSRTHEKDPEAAGASRASTKTTTTTSSRTYRYTPGDLDSLALLFTAAKVLYAGGALTAAAQLLQLCDEARRASEVPLHATAIRNEAAYAAFVVQLLRECPPDVLPAPAAAAVAVAARKGDGKEGGSAAVQVVLGEDAAAAAAPPLYLCGDSHCLSGGCGCYALSFAPAAPTWRHCQPLHHHSS
jgi:hypothetical protein